MPSLILAKAGGGGYTKANLRGARTRGGPNNEDKGGLVLPRNRRLRIMFQKMFDEAGAVCFGSLMLTSNMNKAGVEDGFDRLRRQEEARKNRSTAADGMFCRKAYRHA